MTRTPDQPLASVNNLLVLATAHVIFFGSLIFFTLIDIKSLLEKKGEEKEEKE